MEFDEYVDGSTRLIAGILSSEEYETEEKDAIITEITNELSRHIGDPSELVDYEYILTRTSAAYIDGRLSKVMETGGTLNDLDCENALHLLERQRKNLYLIRERRFASPALKNGNLDEIESFLRKTLDEKSITTKLTRLDAEINELTRKVERDYSVGACSKLINMLQELEEAIDLAKRKRSKIPPIQNKDTKKRIKEVTALKKICEKKEILHQEILAEDVKIDRIIALENSTPDQWNEVITMAISMGAHLAECRKNGWPLPDTRGTNLEQVRSQYELYLEMNKLDKEICGNRARLKSNRSYAVFSNLCSQQAANIERCRKSGWVIPPLVDMNPLQTKQGADDEKAKKDRVRKFKLRLFGVATALIMVFVIVIVGIAKSREGKLQIPFGTDYIIGSSYGDIVEELEDAGFTNIKMVPENSGWEKDGIVTAVTVDSRSDFSKGTYYKPDTTIVIHYSQEGRVEVSELMANWEKQDYQTIMQQLQNAGFTNVSTKAVDTADKKIDQLVASITVNGQSYSTGYCYVLKNAPIEISYYTLKIGISNDNAQFIGKNYSEVVESLKKDGFTNVQTEQVNNGWAKGNTVVDVTINNKTSYSTSDTYSPDVKIVVKYSSNDRVDLTSTLSNWKQLDFEALQTSLKRLGFTNVRVVEKETTTKSSNHLVASITLNNASFNGGDCFLQKNAPVVIEYYRLKISAGNTADGYCDVENYSDLVSTLKGKGFTNIVLKRTDDLNAFTEWGGWIWATPEGSIKSISIAGSSDFQASDYFYFDAEIVIVVNTYKGKGCEDITITAE